MTKSNKRGGGADHLYDAHSFGTQRKFAAAPAQQREARIRMMLFRKSMDLALSRFKWTGLPESIDARFLELTLMQQAVAVWYYDETLEVHLAVKGSGMGYVNMLDNPTSFNIIGPGSEIGTDETASNFVPKTLSAYDPVRHSYLSADEAKRKCVPIWANAMRVPDIDIIEVYTSAIAEMDRTNEINAKNARQNKVLRSSANQQLSVTNFNRQLDEGINGISVTGPMTENPVEALDIGVNHEYLKEIPIMRSRKWNEFMGLLGIDNANQDKKERLVEAEVGANDDQTDNMRYVNLNTRQQACEIINKVFGLNIWVEYRSVAEANERAEKALAAETEQDGNMEESEDENGNVHD